MVRLTTFLLSSLLLAIFSLGCRAPEDAPATPIQTPETASELPGAKLRLEHIDSEGVVTVLEVEWDASVDYQLTHVKEALMKVGPDDDGLFESLELTHDGVKRHREDIIKMMGVTQVPAEYESWLDYDCVRSTAMNKFSAGKVHYDLELRIGGDPQIAVFSIPPSTSSEWPWEIQIGERRFKTGSLAVFTSVKHLLWGRAGGYPFHPGNLEKFVESWDDFWVDPDVWRQHRILGDTLRSREVAENLGGFDSSRFEIVKSEGLNTLERMKVELRTLKGPIDEVLWEFPAPQSQPTSDWNTLNREVSDCLQLLGKHPWIEAWKNEDSTVRKIRLVGSAQTGYPVDYATAAVERAWEQAGLPGRPQFHLELIIKEPGAISKDFFPDRTLVHLGPSHSIIGGHFKAGSGEAYLRGGWLLLSVGDRYIVVTPDGKRRESKMEAPKS